MRLNWFSPLPPAATGVAQYTRRLLPALAKRAEVILWTDQEEWDRSLETFARVRPYRLANVPWDEFNRAEVNVYQLGNHHAFHGTIWEISRRQPGLVVLHDFCLQDLVQTVHRQANDISGYCDLMQRHYGVAGGRWAGMVWSNELTGVLFADAFPLTAAAVENALGVVVHTRSAFELLRGADRWPVALLPLPYAATPRGADHRPRGHGRPYRLIVPGPPRSNRRVAPLLRALQAFPLREHFHLDIFGSLADELDVHKLIRTLGIAGQVSAHGAVPEGRLEAALGAADLAVNLCFPAMEEPSASQLQIWDHALPSLVSRLGWFATLSEDSVAFVRPEREVADLHGHLQAFLSQPGAYAHLGANARRLLVERHIPAHYVEGLLKLSEAVPQQRRQRVVIDLAERVGRLLDTPANAATTPWISERVAVAIEELMA
jgi:glycosyltransferase involved in cell wall biosynthesis